MRFLILILIFINIGVWTFLNQSYFFQVDNPAPKAEIEPGKLTVLSKHQIESLIKSQPTEAAGPDADTQTTEKKPTEEEAKKPEKQAKTEPTKPKAATPKLCYQWGEFNNAQLKKAQAITKKLGLSTSVKKKVIAKADRYWVYLPPLGSADAARNMADTLRAQGISDLYVLNSPDFRNAISFGVFSDSERADNLLRSLKAKGIQNVVKAPRNQTKKTTYRLNINAVSDANYKKLKQNKNAFPTAKLKSRSC